MNTTTSNNIKQNIFDGITKKLMKDTQSIKYGDVFVQLKIHDGRIISVTHSITATEKNLLEKPALIKLDRDNI